MNLLQQPVTKKQFELELLGLPPKEAESRREFWTLCEALQAMEDMRCPPPDWFMPIFLQVLERASDERAESWRDLRHSLLEHMGEYQKQRSRMRHLQ